MSEPDWRPPDEVPHNRWTALLTFWTPARARAVLLLVALGLSLRLITFGGFRLNDGARHALSGVFLMDLVREGGYWHPLTYAEQYYARYPALGIPYNYPPLFHTVEAVFFAVLGVSAVTARLCVVAFHLVSVWLLYELVRRSWGAGTAFWAGWFYVTNPLVLFWSRQTMLEAPGTAMMLLASLALLALLERRTKLRAGLWLLSLAACLATKQTTAFLIPVHAVVLLATSGRLFRVQPRTWALIGGLTLAGVVLAVVSYQFSPYQIRALTRSPEGSRMSLAHLACFPLKLPVVVGWEVLAGGLLGLGWIALRRARWSQARLWLAWLIGFYLVQICLTGHHTRYAYFWMPPFAVLAALGWMAVWRSAGPAWLVLAVLAVLTIPVSVRAVQSRPPLYDGYERAAQLVAALDGGASVLVDGAWDGDFVFFSRQYDSRRRLVLRGSKLLYTFASYRNLGYQSFVHSDEELFAFLDRYGVRYVVVEDYDMARTEPGARLRRLLATERFRPVAVVPIYTEGGLTRAKALEIFDYLGARQPTAESLEITFPGLKRVIRVPLERLWQAQPAGPPAF